MKVDDESTRQTAQHFVANLIREAQKEALFEI